MTVLLLAFAGSAAAESFQSAGSGLWSDAGTWTNTTVPAGVGTVPTATDTVVIGAGHTVTLDATSPAAGATIATGGTLDLATFALSVGGDVALESGSTVQSTGGAGALIATGGLSIASAAVSNTGVTVASSGGSTPSTTFTAGTTSTWSGATLAQVGGTATLAGHTANGLAPAFDRVALAITGRNAFPAGMTLSASSEAGSLAFTASAADGPSDPAMLALGSLTASGTQTVTASFTGYAGQLGDRANLVSTSSGSPAGLTATDTAGAAFTTTSDLLFAIYGTLSNTAAPTVVSTNVNTTQAQPGDIVTCRPGTWTQPATFTTTWKRGATPITGQTATTYTVTSADVGSTLTCSVVAAAGSLSATADATNAVAVPAAPSVAIAAPPARVTTASTAVAYALGAGSSVARCALNGVALPSCPNPVPLTGYANGATATLTITVVNAAGTTATASASFVAAVPPTLDVDTPTGDLRTGDLATLAIRTDPDAAVTCAVDGSPLACGAAVAVAVPPVGAATRVTVRAASAFGATTVERTVTAASGPQRLRSPVFVAAGETVTLPAPGYYGPGADTAGYDWEGPLRLTWTGDRADRAAWGLRFTAPDRPGTYRQRLRWGGTQVDAVTVTVFDATAAPTTRRIDGATSRTATLRCPWLGAGTTYQWWIDGVLSGAHRTRALPAGAVPRTGTVSCAAHDPRKDTVTQLRVLVDRGVRMAASTTSSRRTLRVSASAARTATITVRLLPKRPKDRPRTAFTTRAKLTRGTRTVRLPRALPRSGYRIELRLGRSGGGASRPLTIERARG